MFLTHIGRSEKVFIMKRLLIILILTLNFQSWTKADDVSDFEIEGISIGDSLLDYFSEEEINNFTIDYYPKSKKFFVRDSNSSKFKVYDGMQFALKKNNYKIYGLSGALYFENLDHCLSHKESVEKQVSDIFKDLKKFSTEGIHYGDPSGKSYHYQTQYTFAKGGVIAVECVDWSDKMKDINNWWDHFSITIYSKEYEKFVRNEGY